ncbi:MAG TPA: hypothetical protein VFR30_05695, partial [Lysobacter sp.]|nr:hypothetical protein [Lysobacter sp.]
MRSKLHRSAFCVLLAFSGAAFAQEATEAAAAAAAPAPAPAAAEAAPVATATAPAATNNKVGAPEAGKALIVFFRPSKLTGAAIGFKV